MTKKGIQNSSIEQIRNDHETETAFKADDPKNMAQVQRGPNKFCFNGKPNIKIGPIVFGLSY